MARKTKLGTAATKVLVTDALYSYEQELQCTAQMVSTARERKKLLTRAYNARAVRGNIQLGYTTLHYEREKFLPSK